MANQNKVRLNPSVARGPYTAKPPMDPEQARQELAHLERSPRNPSDQIQQAEMAALRRIAGARKS